MRLNLLSSATMISLSAAWLDPGRDRPLLGKLPRCAPLVADVQAGHDGLMRAQSRVTVASPETQAFVEKCSVLDAKHDRKLRGIRKVLDGLALLTDDADEARSYEALRDEVSGPEGGEAVNSSFVDEASNADGSDKRLSKASKALAKSLGAGDRTVDKWIKDWRGIGEKLGEAAAGKRESGADADRAETGDVLKARNAWVRAVSDVLSMLDRDAPDRATRQKLTSPIAVEVAKAEAALGTKKRKKDKKNPDPPEETPAKA